VARILGDGKRVRTRPFTERIASGAPQGRRQGQGRGVGEV